jgi:diacylglycerol kinase family enzyme
MMLKNANALVCVMRKAPNTALIVNPNLCRRTGKNCDELNAKKKVLLKSKERKVTVTIDGEPIGILSAKFRVFPKALIVVA